MCCSAADDPGLAAGAGDNPSESIPDGRPTRSRAALRAAGSDEQVAVALGSGPDPVWPGEPPLTEGADHTARLLALAAVILIGAWTLAILLFNPVPFAVYAPQGAVGVEAAVALARLFGALVLSLFAWDPIGQRLRWVAAGFGVLGVGGLIFGFLQPLIFGSLDLNTSIYASLLVRTLADILFVVGLVPSRPPHFSRRSLLVSTVCFTALCSLVVNARGSLPPLVTLSDAGAEVVTGAALLRGLTIWHWLLAPIPLGLAIIATWGALRHSWPGMLGRWLLVAMVLLTGSHLHTLFWPSGYSPVLTTADLLRLLFAATVTIGGVLELRRIAAEYATLLVLAREHTLRLNELGRMKADFVAMVAHELSSPIAAIRALADMLTSASLDAQAQARALSAIRAETDLLNALVADVHASAQVEREDFAIQRRPVSLSALLSEAAAYAKTLPGQHPIVIAPLPSLAVVADRDRIGQVLRNLISNATKYCAPGTPIEIRATVRRSTVRIEVVDQGPGIAPADLNRIFEKFGRGRDQSGRLVPGLGLGLYLSQRIVSAHGSQLSVDSTLGEGSSFAFELEVAQ